MVMYFISLLLTTKLYASTFNVDKGIEVVLPDSGVKSIMKTIENPAIFIIDVAEIELNKKKILIQYSSGASDDPTFTFYWNEGKKSFDIQGKKLNYAGEGVFLISGHTNNMFDTKRKIVFDGRNFKEIHQPFYAIDITSVALIEGTAHQTANDKSLSVFSFKKGEELKILGSDQKQEYFLIKNKDGLTGWVHISFTQRPTFFKEIYYAGD